MWIQPRSVRLYISFKWRRVPGALFTASRVLLQVDVNTEVGVIHDYALRELRLFTDYGRTSRPLFIVEEGNQLAFEQQHLESLIRR